MVYLRRDMRGMRRRVMKRQRKKVGLKQIAGNVKRVAQDFERKHPRLAKQGKDYVRKYATKYKEVGKAYLKKHGKRIAKKGYALAKQHGKKALQRALVEAQRKAPEMMKLARTLL